MSSYLLPICHQSGDILQLRTFSLQRGIRRVGFGTWMDEGGGGEEERVRVGRRRRGDMKCQDEVVSSSVKKEGV